jgi:putative membrane protein
VDELVTKLAVERTRLAEERTSLAYIRTGMSLFLGGIFFVGYFPGGTVFSYVGYFTMAIAAIFTGYGFQYNSKSRKIIDTILNEVR